MSQKSSRYDTDQTLRRKAYVVPWGSMPHLVELGSLENTPREGFDYDESIEQQYKGSSSSPRITPPSETSFKE